SAPRGWRIDASRDETRIARQIVFTLDRPLQSAAGVRLRIRLKHYGSAVGQALGRFRLSVTSSSTPQRVVEIPAKLRPILAIPATNRTEKQRAELSAFYRTVAPSLKPTRDRLAALEKELAKLSIPTALVMRERVAYERPSAYVHRRGSFMDKTEKVYAGVPEVLHPLGEDQMPNRLGLAHWLVDERNPLTARVAVNRACEQFFGRGLGGPSVFPPQPEGIWDIPYSDEKWIPSTGEDRYRRGLYVFIRRSAPYPSLLTFDATSRERCTVRRVRTDTPLQALITLNDEAFFEAARALAARILRQ